MVNINLDIDGTLKSYDFPESWDDVTVGQFEKLSLIQNSRNSIQYIAEVISALSELTVDEFFMVPSSDFDRLSSVVNFTLTPVKAEPKDSIILNEEEYFTVNDFSKMNIGEVFSIETIVESKAGVDGVTNIDSIISKLLCIFLRKKVDGKIETFKNTFMEREELFKQVKITDVHNLFLFFSIGKS